MKNKNNIDNYFERLKQNPPLMDIEQVQQILREAKVKAKTEAEVEVEVEVKKAPRNLLRFTIMTTFFAIVFFAIMFWPKAQESNIPTNTDHYFENPMAEDKQPTVSFDTEAKPYEIESNSKLHKQSKKVAQEISSVETKRTDQIKFKALNCFIQDQTKSYSKFEIKLSQNEYSGKINESNNVLESGLLILNIRSRELNKISSGDYIFSALIPDYRPTMSFSGEFYYLGKILKTTTGSLMIEQEDSTITIKYHLIFENNQEIRGDFSGNYSTIEQHFNEEEIAIDEYEYLNIQPIDGQKFVLKLSEDELRRIGFEITDSSIIYKNIYNDIKYFYGYYRKRNYEPINGLPLPEIDEFGNKFRYDYDFLYLRNTALSDSSIKNNYDFYPVCTSNIYFGNVVTINNNHQLQSNFDIRNDDLLPIYLPSLDGVIKESIIWFQFSETLYNILDQYKPLLDEFKFYKEAKKYHKFTDLVVYDPTFDNNETNILKLDNEYLAKLGIHVYADSLCYKGALNNYTYSITINNDMSAHYYASDQYADSLINENTLAIIATFPDGTPYGDGLLQYFASQKNGINNQYGELIPVGINNAIGSNLKMIFWFLPSEGFFKSLPDSIGNEIRNEYNYVIAEDKTELEQPVCKYFEECKNTLNVSSFKVYPNPAEDRATISFQLSESIEASISLIDLAGREINQLQPKTAMSAGNHYFEVDVSNVPEGIYLILLHSDRVTQTQRFIIDR